MTYVILEPRYVAEKCFLAEARNWIAFHRFPLAMGGVEEVDYRFDPEMQEDYRGEFISKYDMEFDEFECIRIGLPINPEYEALFTEEPTMPLEYYESLIKSITDKPAQDKLIAEHKLAALYWEKQDAWDERINAIREVAEAKLFLALKEGRIKAFGRKLLAIDYDENNAILEEKKIGLCDLAHEEILADFWRAKNIDWNDSCAESETDRYIHIYVETSNLFAAFPPPPEAETKAVKVVAGNYVLDTEYSGAGPLKGRVGRPAHSWDQFLLEVHKRFLDESVPEKQEAFIAQMQEWCKKHWGKEVGRSTILEKVKPYYDSRREKI